MSGWNDYLMKQEQYRDQLRDAEKHRLIKQVRGDCQESALQRAARGMLAAARGRGPVRDESPCGGPSRLVEKVA
jgi:hypothetical protein